MNARAVVLLSLLGACTTINVYQDRDDEPEAGVDASVIGSAPLDASVPRCPADGGSLDLKTAMSLGIDVLAPLPARATSTVRLSVNLDVGSTVPFQDFDYLSPATSSNFSSTFTAYDSRGGSHQVTVYFAKLNNATWAWHVLVYEREVRLSGGAGAAEVAAGSLEFDTNGALVRELTAFSSFSFVGAQTQSIEFDFGTSQEEGASGLDGTTNFANDSTTNDLRQDGYAAGSLVAVNTDWSGALIGTYTNGQSRTVGHCP